jgi:outer membrane protein TolC
MPSDVLGRRRVSTELNAVIVQAGVSRPDLLAVRHRAMAAKHGVGAARASYLPHLNAFLEVNLDSDEILRREGESWTAGAKLTWDLFSGGRSIGAHRAAKAQAAAAEAQADFKKSDVIREVRKAYRDVMAADTKVDVAEEGIRQAEERLRIMQLQYQEGLATATDLLAAEAELTRARVRRLQALYALNLGIAQLEFSVGSPVE